MFDFTEENSEHDFPTDVSLMCHITLHMLLMFMVVHSVHERVVVKNLYI